MSGFADPVAGGGGDIIRPSLHSPDYVAGSAGWSINRDGSAELNNATIRGTVTASTFDGTDFVINSAGAFFYSGTPAAGNLIASIASTSGTDAYGNPYLAGVVSYGNPVWSAVNGGRVEVGGYAGGAPDPTNVGGIQDSGTGSTAYSSTVAGGTFTDQVVMTLICGEPGQAEGSGNTPHVTFADSAGTSPVDLQTSGAWYNLKARSSAANAVPLTTDTPAGQTADLLDLKANGATKLAVGPSGDITTVGTIAPLVAAQAQDLASSTWTSTGYGASTRALATSVVLPASGKALVRFAVKSLSSVSGDNVLSDVVVTGSTSGTLHAASDTSAVITGLTAADGGFVTEYLLTGVSGETLTATAQHRVAVSGTTGTATFRSITIQTLPA